VALRAFCAWLVLLPLPFGAGRTWALALVLPPLFLIAAALAWSRRAPGDGLLAFLARPPGLLFAAFVLWVALQLLPWPGVGPASVVPYRTGLYLLLAFACAVTAWVATAVVRSDADLRTLMRALVAGGLLQATLATLIMATGTGFSVLDSEIVAQSVATGTFVNRNHLAGYLNIALAAGCGLMAGHLAPPRPGRRWGLRLRDALELLLGGKARLRLVLVMLVIVLIATRSRMGNAAFFAALVVATCVYAVFERERRRGLLWFAASVVAVDLLLIGAWVGVDRVMERIADTPLVERLADTPAASPGANEPADEAGAARRDQSVQERLEPALDAVAIVRDHPVRGTGGGTFYLVYMAYQPNWEGFYNHAHNDYLEIAADTGLVGLALLLGIAVHALWTALRLLRERSNPALRSAGFAVVMSVSAMALHALVDFNLHIPANTLTFCTMLALPWAAQRLRARRPREAGDARRAPRDGVEAGAALAPRPEGA
jgi:O-antigen ligase